MTAEDVSYLAYTYELLCTIVATELAPVNRVTCHASCGLFGLSGLFRLFSECPSAPSADTEACMQLILLYGGLEEAELRV